MSNSHLTETEILEFLRTRADDEQTPLHIAECRQCRMEFEQHRLLFDKLKQETLLAPQGDIWAKIEVQQRLKKQEKKQRVKNWSFTSIAASLLLIIGLQWNMLENDRTIQNSIQASILQSQQLENLLFNENGFERANYFEKSDIKVQIAELDEEIQQAYLNNLSSEIILALWKKRVEILQELKVKQESSENMEFI